MGRRDYKVQYATCHKGINQQAELAELDECADARNVWAPNGRVIARPGYVGVTSLADSFTQTAISSVDIVKESPLGTFALTSLLDTLPIARRWYFATVDAPPANCSGIQIDDTLGAVLNANATWAAVEYWNGTEWAPLKVVEPNGHLHDDGTPGFFSFFFPMPADIAYFPASSSGLGNVTEGYTLRFLIEGAALSAGTDVDVSVAYYITDVGNYTTAPTLFSAQFPYTKRYLSVLGYTGSSNAVYYNLPALLRPVSGSSSGRVTRTIKYLNDEPATLAVVSQFNEAYLAYNRKVTVHKAYPTSSDDVVAKVESDSSIVGTGGLYDADQIIQLKAWPNAKYMAFYGDRLWAANLDDSGDYSIRWSAPIPYYKVWPTINIETLMEDDNSPITGLKGFQQNMTVFKEDSIWMMEDVGTNDLGLESFNPRRVVAGIGCVSNSSIAEVQGRLVFLAEDGVYAYDGTPQVQKLSYKIQDTINSIVPARRPFAVGVNLSQKNLYLLAVATNGSNTNNTVLVWDYKNDAWWIWDNIEAQQWLLDEGASDDQRLYFQDSHMRVFELMVGNTDNGAAISSYVLTQRFDYTASGSRDVGELSQKLRMIEITSTNDSRTVDVELLANDEPNGSTGAIDYTDDAEKEWGALVWNVDSYTVKRRRRRRLMFYRTIEWCQVKVSHSSKDAPFELASVGVGTMPLGKR